MHTRLRGCLDEAGSVGTWRGRQVNIINGMLDSHFSSSAASLSFAKASCAFSVEYNAIGELNCRCAPDLLQNLEKMTNKISY